MTTHPRGAPTSSPSHSDLLGLFCELVDEYDRLGAAFPVSVSSYELGPDAALDERERWHRIVRAMAVRKFVLGKNDAVRADKVLTALEQSLTATEDRVHLTRWREDFESIGATIRINEGADAARALAEVLEDLIYGCFLHGDLDRWRRTSSRWRGSVDLALWMFGEDAEHYIRRLRSAIYVASQEGRLSAEATAAVESARARSISPGVQ